MRLACLVDVFVRRSVSFVVLRGICDVLLCPTMFRLSRPDIGCPFLEIVRYFRFVVRVECVVHNCRDDDWIGIADLGMFLVA